MGITGGIPLAPALANVIIDAHHHLWRYAPDQYPWIGTEMGVLKRDFVVDDLLDEVAKVDVDATVVVQARQEPEETEWLLDVARETREILGVVGWVDLLADDLDHVLERLSRNSMFVGVRHVLQDEPDDAFMLRDDFNRGIGRLRHYGLIYDVLIYSRHLENAKMFADRHPDQIFVVDHLAKPSIRTREMEPWKSALAELARREHCYCKLSGVVTEADWRDWTADQLRPYLDAALEAFGPERLMFGSDWPVCLLACDYAGWYHLARDFASDLSASEQDRIFGGTAAEAYRLPANTSL